MCPSNSWKCTRCYSPTFVYAENKLDSYFRDLDTRNNSSSHLVAPYAAFRKCKTFVLICTLVMKTWLGFKLLTWTCCCLDLDLTPKTTTIIPWLCSLLNCWEKSKENQKSLRVQRVHLKLWPLHCTYWNLSHSLKQSLWTEGEIYCNIKTLFRIITFQTKQHYSDPLKNPAVLGMDNQDLTGREADGQPLD